MKFIYLLNLQNKKARQSLGSKISWLITTVLSCFSFIIEAIRIYGLEHTMVQSAARMWSLNGNGESTFHFLYGMYLMFGLPIVSVLIFSDEILSSKNNHIIQFVLIRTGRMKYYIATAIVSFTRCLLMVFSSLVFNQLFWLICCPVSSNQPMTQFVYTDFEGAYLLIFPNLFFDHPYLYNLIYIGMISVLSGLFAFFGVSLCFIIKKQFQIFIIPVIVYLAENFLSAAIGYYNFSISEILSPSPVVKNLSFTTYIVFSLSIFIISIIFFIYGTVIKKDEFA